MTIISTRTIVGGTRTGVHQGLLVGGTRTGVHQGSHALSDYGCHILAIRAHGWHMLATRAHGWLAIFLRWRYVGHLVFPPETVTGTTRGRHSIRNRHRF